jgi:uncharacterized phiE125 gp8 family phage protein
MKAVLVTAPAVEPITIPEAQAHLRLDSHDDNDWLAGAIRTARQRCENVTGVKLITQTWDLYADRFPSGGVLVLPNSASPVASVTSINYTPRDAAETVFAAENYILDRYGQPASIWLKSGTTWPGVILEVVNAVRVRVVLGYGADGLSVPAELIAAMKLMIGDLYEYRESNYPAGMVVPTNDRVDDLFRMFETKTY